MIVTPLFDRVLVLPIDDEGLTKGSLVIPDIARNSSLFGYGTVVAVGPGRHDAQGVLVKIKLKEGETVMYPRKVGLVIPIPDHDGEEIDHLLFREPEIFAKVTGLERQSSILSSDGRKLLAMNPSSMAKPDVGYENNEKTEIARREGWVDVNPDGTDDHVDEVH
jgi:chaperonin GroES